MTFNINPIIFELGPFQIRYYGLMYVVGFFIALLLLRRFSKQGFLKLSYNEINDLLFWAFVGLLVGARLFYSFVYAFPVYVKEPWRILIFWRGGLSFHGGLIGVAIAIWLFNRRKKLPWLQISDSLVLIAPIALFFGRIGNFLNGELFGRVTTLPWGIIFPYGGPQPRHPSQLYEAIGEGLILAAIVWITKRFTSNQGVLSATFLVGYGIIRFLIEFFRLPDQQLGFVLGPFSMGQVLCSLMIIAGGILMYFAIRGRFGEVAG
ncbi:prolipoprotein diacylglyceryl transferase [Bdellovibrionota bacterium]